MPIFSALDGNNCWLSRTRGGGDAGVSTPRCSATPIRCMHWRPWTNIFVTYRVWTTTTTPQPRPNPSLSSLHPFSPTHTHPTHPLPSPPPPTHTTTATTTQAVSLTVLLFECSLFGNSFMLAAAPAANATTGGSDGYASSCFLNG